MDMGSFFGTKIGTCLNYKRDRYVHCSGPLNEAHIKPSTKREPNKKQLPGLPRDAQQAKEAAFGFRV